MKMRDGHDRCQFTFDGEEHAERKSVDDCAPKRRRDDRKLQRSLLDPAQRGAKCLEKLVTEPVALALVPEHRFERVQFCFGTNLQTSHLPSVAQTLLEPFDDLWPGPGYMRRSTVRLEPFLENGLLPFVQRYLIHAGGDVIPQRLDVIDLVLDRKIVESWRRQRQGMCHDSDYNTGSC